jgi:hypothetical protein
MSSAPAPVTKKWWQSKTNWLGILTIAVAIIGIVGKVVPPFAGGAAAVVGILNIVLRIWFTNVPIG